MRTGRFLFFSSMQIGKSRVGCSDEARVDTKEIQDSAKQNNRTPGYLFSLTAARCISII